jgi:hypothetical protein
VIGPDWEWQSASCNWLPLGEWAEWKQGTRERDGSVRFDMRCAFEADYVPEGLGLVYEAGVVESVTLNGAPVLLAGSNQPTGRAVELADDCHRVAPLRVDALRYGANALRATARLGAGDRVLLDEGATVGPLALVGRFALQRVPTGGRGKTQRWRLVRPATFVALGAWAEAGFPRYAGTATYAQTVRIPALPTAAEVRLVVRAAGKHVGGQVSLALDGRPVVAVSVDPWVFGLKGVVREGLNRIELTCESGVGARLSSLGAAGLEAVSLEYRVRR